MCGSLGLIFLTVGTYPIQFDRLVKAVDDQIADGTITEEVFAQIGHCDYEPKHMQWERLMSKEDFDAKLNAATAIISHAGMGNITMAIDQKLPLVVMPRIEEYKEHVNNHQLDTARKFEELGHVLVAYEAEDLQQKLKESYDFVPKPRVAQPEAVAERIGAFLRSI